METTALRELLAARLGLDADSLGPSFLNSVARWGLQHSGHTDLRALLDEAAAGGETWQRLVEHVVVSETWFFRDKVPFYHVVDAVQAKWSATGLPVRVLSCPCSTGEEPYSVAIALIEAGLPPDAFMIDAADVSLSAVRAAEVGVFRSRSFRNAEFAHQERYFDHERGARQWRLKPPFRDVVRFFAANLVSLQGLEHVQSYDVVLCRNLLIYLHAEARGRVLRTVRRLLATDGVLIVGHAEPAIAREHGFKSSGHPRAFAFVTTPIAGRRELTARTVRLGVAGERRRAANKAQIASLDLPVGQTTAVGAQPHGVAPALESIRRLGDQGQIKEAIYTCRDYLRRFPDSVDGNFLLGVLLGANGQGHAAERAFRRVLYLEPNHASALTYVALACDARGDAAGAARLRVRVKRSVGREESEP